MIHRTIICDYCGKKINPANEDYLSLDAYWHKKDIFPEDMHFHEECWDRLLAYLETING